MLPLSTVSEQSSKTRSSTCKLSGVSAETCAQALTAFALVMWLTHLVSSSYSFSVIFPQAAPKSPQCLTDWGQIRQGQETAPRLAARVTPRSSVAWAANQDRNVLLPLLRQVQRWSMVFQDFLHLSVGVWKEIDCWWLCMSLNCFLLAPPPPPFAPSHTIVFPAKLNKLKCVCYILGWRKWCKCLSFSLLTYLLVLPVDWLHCIFLHDFQMTVMMVTAHKAPWSTMASSSFPPQPKSPPLCPAKRSGLLLKTLSRSLVLTSSRSLVLTRSKSQVWTGSWLTLSQAVLMSVIFSHWKFRFPVQLPPQRPRSSEGQLCRWPVLWTTCLLLPKSHVRYRCVKLDQKNMFG